MAPVLKDRKKQDNEGSFKPSRTKGRVPCWRGLRNPARRAVQRSGLSVPEAKLPSPALNTICLVISSALCTFFAPAMLRTVPCSTSRRQDRCIGRQHTVSWSAGRQMSIGSSAKHLQPANCYAVCTRGDVCNWQPSRSLRAGSPSGPCPAPGHRKAGAHPPAARPCG